MALSNLSPKDAVNTYQVLLDIASALKTLTDDPQALNKAIVDSISLSDKEQAKADLARADIANYEALILEQKNNIKVISDKEDSLKTRESDLSKAQDKFYDDRALLAQRENAYNLNVEQLKKDQISLQKERGKFDAEKADFVGKQSLLAKQQSDLEDAQATLKSKADQLKVISEGL